MLISKVRNFDRTQKEICDQYATVQKLIYCVCENEEPIFFSNSSFIFGAESDLKFAYFDRAEQTEYEQFLIFIYTDIDSAAQ